MWCLQADGWSATEGEGSERVWRLSGGGREGLQRRVGRRPDVEIFITGDKSISREHARLALSQNNSLSLTDLASAYGTFIAPASSPQTQLHKLDPQQETTLACGDLVRFGALHNLWRVSKLKLETCTSTCKLNAQLLDALKSMSVTVMPQWTTDCTHLTMSSITLTLKVLSALVSGKPIVTASFWSTCYENFQKDVPFPDPADYLPPISEPTLNQQTANFRVDQTRCKVFANKLFIFVSRSQMEKYGYVIKAASGKTILLNDAKMSKSQLCSASNIIVQCIMEELSQDSQTVKTVFDEIVQYMKTKNFRVIPEAEIGLAILCNSLNKYCNPNFNFSAEILKTPGDILQKSTSKSVEILAPETQQLSLSMYQTCSKKVEESTASSLTHSTRSNITTDLSPKEFTLIPTVEPIKNRKTQRSPTFEWEEPPRKKIGTQLLANTITTTNRNEKPGKSTDEDEKIFNFVNIENIKENPKRSMDLNIKSKINNSKRKANILSVDEEDLFNFVEDAPCEPKPQAPNKLKRFSLEDLASEKKKMRFENDVTDNSLNSRTSVKNKKFDSFRWISSKEPSSAIQPKIEKIEVESNADQSIENQMRMLELQPAVIIINNNLIKKENETSNRSDYLNDTRSNFKKFVKIQPLNKQTEVISRSKLSVYESDGKNLSKELRSRFSDDEEDDNDQQTSLIDRHIRSLKSSSKKVRRL
ncbi:nibrin [Arctopsyche grandis]|uniref:nibrin n=1 Tax=Arctopsyche grandis TaxID=121162 RepID=UPI00406D7497